MPSLLIADRDRAAITALLSAAFDAVLSRERALGLALGADQTVPGDHFEITLPTGYSVGFNFEWQGLLDREPVLCRHLSVATSPGALPSEEDLARIMKEFSFVNPPRRCLCYVHPCGPGWDAVNVLEPESGDWDEIPGGFDGLRVLLVVRDPG